MATKAICRRKYGCRARHLSPGGQGAPYIDTTAPGTITDLEVLFPPDDNRANRIQFTRPGDDGFVGQSTLWFQMRYSTDGVIETELDWSASTLWPIGGPFSEWTEDNSVAGAQRSIELLGIDTLPGGDTWIAIRYRDAAGNVGGVSVNPLESPQIIIT